MNKKIINSTANAVRENVKNGVMPKLKQAIASPVVKNTLTVTGIALAGVMIATSWYHRSLRKTMHYEHELWKDGQDILSDDV
jgi:uncharacterized membrane protein